MLLWTFMCTSFCVNICLCFFQVDIWEWAYGSPVLTFLRKARLFYSIPLYEYTTFSCQFTTWWAFALLFVFSNKHSCASFLWTFFFTLRQICRSRIAGSQDRCQSVQSLSRVRLFATPWTAARQASLSITNSRSLLRLMSTESVMPSNHRILCHPLLLLPSIFPSIRVFSDESAFCVRRPNYWSFSFNISPSSEYSGLISFRMNWLDLLAVSEGLSRVFSNTTVQKHQFFSTQLSLYSNLHIHTWPLENHSLD